MKAKVIYSIEKKDGKFVFLVFDGESKKLLHEFELDWFDLSKLHQQTMIALHSNNVITGMIVGTPTPFKETMQILADDDTTAVELRERARKELEFLKDREQ